jgi:hypothetical protein
MKLVMKFNNVIIFNRRNGEFNGESLVSEVLEYILGMSKSGCLPRVPLPYTRADSLAT